MSCQVGADVPKFDRLVPRARVDLIRVQRVELYCENFVLVSVRLRPTADHLNRLQGLIVVNLDLGQKTSHCKAFAISGVVDALVLILRVEWYFLA